MSNLPLWALVLGVVAAVVAVILLLSGPPSSTSTGPETGPEGVPVLSLIPASVEGFVLMERLERVDPIFEGEEYSSHASFAPTADSPYQGAVERVGVALFVFQDPQAISAAQQFLFLNYEPQPMELAGQSLLMYADEEAGQVGLLWVRDGLLYEVLATGPADAQGYDLELIEQAARHVAQAVIAAGAEAD